MHNGCKVNNILTITKLNTFFQRQYPEGYVFKGEYHDFYEVVCVFAGEIIVTAGKDIYTLKAGDMTYHPPGEFHAFRESGKTHPTVMIISFEAINFPDVNGKIFSISEHNISEIKEIYKMLLKSFEFENINPGTKTWLDSVKSGEEISAAIFTKKLELFLLSLLKNETSDDEHIMETSHSRSFYKILTVMEENILNALNVESIANLCGISIPTLEKTVFRFLGYGAMTHYNILRMQRAYKMLADGLSVKEVSLNLGFSNQNYFSARFKKHYGFPPSSVTKS